MNALHSYLSSYWIYLNVDVARSPSNSDCTGQRQRHYVILGRIVAHRIAPHRIVRCHLPVYYPYPIKRTSKNADNTRILKQVEVETTTTTTIATVHKRRITTCE